MTSTISPAVTNDISDFLNGYELSLRARNRSPKTIVGYLQTAQLFRHNVDAYDALVFIQEGRALVIMSFGATVSPFDTSMAEQLTTTVVGRLTST